MATRNAPDAVDRAIPLAEAAKRLGLSSWTLRRWAQQRRVASIKLGQGRGARLMFLESTVRAILAANTREASSPEALRIAS
jgi:excisionase family DNA binding protein